jgi:hypothetical protein
MNGVSISLSGSQTSTTTSDANGNYSFTNLPAGSNYTVVPTLNHFSFAPVNLNFNDLSSDQQASFQGTLNKHSISGKITDSGGTPLSGVSMSLTGSQTSTATSDANGNYSFANLPAGGDYMVVPALTHFQFTPVSRNFTDLSSDQQTSFQGTLNKHSISGKLTDSSGTPMSGVSISLSGSVVSTATTDATGNYSFANLPAGGSYSVVPVSSEFFYTPVNLSFSDLSSNQLASFVGKPLPEIVTAVGTNRALALDTVTFIRDPFDIFNPSPIGSNGLMRVMVFVKNLDQIQNLSQITAEAEDEAGKTYPLEIEFMGTVPGLNWLKQINIKLSANLPAGETLLLSVRIPGGSSNKARLRLAE